MQDVLTEELVGCFEEQQEAQDMNVVQDYWRKKQEILPLLIKEGTSEPHNLDLKPLPMELKYVYLEEQEQSPFFISSLLSASKENSLLGILKKNK